MTYRHLPVGAYIICEYLKNFNNSYCERYSNKNGVTLKDMVESMMIASRVGVNDLEEHLRQKRLRWFGHIARRDEEVEIKKMSELKIEGQRKRGRPVKQWIDVVEEDVKKRGVVQQKAGYK